MAAQLNKMRSLQRTLTEEDAIVANNADLLTVQLGKATEERITVHGLVLVKLGAVKESGYDLADVIRAHQVRADNAVQFFGRIDRL